MRIYGVLDSNDCQIDVSHSERGAKNYATRHGYTIVSYRWEYYVIVVAEKIDGKWIKL